MEYPCFGSILYYLTIWNHLASLHVSDSALCIAAVVGQTKLIAPEKMRQSIKLVDDQMNWCDSAMEVSQCHGAKLNGTQRGLSVHGLR